MLGDIALLPLAPKDLSQQCPVVLYLPLSMGVTAVTPFSCSLGLRLFLGHL